MNPLFAPIAKILTEEPFQVQFADEWTGPMFVFERKGEKYNHCLHSIHQLSYLIHSIPQADAITTHLKVASASFLHDIRSQDVSIGQIKADLLFRDFALTQSVLQDEGNRKMWDELALQIKNHMLQLGNALRKAIDLEQRVCVNEWCQNKKDYFSVLQKPLLEFGREIRARTVKTLCEAIFRQQELLSAEKGFMYYVLIRTDTKRCHAFALQQLQGANRTARYFLWQSWYQRYSLCGDSRKGERAIDDISSFLADLTAMLDADMWAEESDALWRRWFFEAPLAVPSRLGKIKCGTSGQGVPVAFMKGASLCFTFADFNPRTIETDIRTHFQKIQERADQGLVQQRNCKKARTEEKKSL